MPPDHCAGWCSARSSTSWPRHCRLVAAIAAFLTWVSLSAQGVTLTVSGTGSVSGADAGVPIYDLIKSNSDLQSLKDQGVDVSYSIGIWLTIVGGVVIVLGAIVAMIGSRKQN